MRYFVKYLTLAIPLLATSTLTYSDETLSGDQIKALISGKTVHVTVLKNGNSWRTYHAEDGTSHDSRGGEGKWYVTESGEHCNESLKVKVKCGKIVNNGDGTYTRSTLDGNPLVKWTKIVDEKDF